MGNFAFLSEKRLSHPSITQVSWASSQSLLDFEGVIVDSASYFQDSGLTNANQKLSVLQKREAEIEEYASHDRPIVFLLAYCPKFSYVNGRLNINFSPADRLHRCQLKDQSGLNISVASDAPAGIKEFYNATKNQLQFNATVVDCPGTPLFFITGTKSVLGCKSNIYKNEKTYFFPNLSPSIFGLTSTMLLVGNAFKEFFGWIESSALKAQFELPSNHEKYHSPQEVDLSQKLQVLEEQKNILEQEIIQTTDAIRREQMLKHLFLSNGDVLAEATKMALTELGFITVNGPDKRDDLMCLEEVPPMVIEVKGRETKSAKESDCAQLEKWAATYLENNEIQPKPLLVVNGFFHSPPEDRNEAVFPHQMLNYAVQRNHALISGIDLYRLLLWRRADPSKQSYIKDLLKNTIGCVDLSDAPSFPVEAYRHG